MSTIDGLKWDRVRLKWVHKEGTPRGTYRDEHGHLFVDRPQYEEDMTLFQRVGAWKDMNGVSTTMLIDDLTLRVIELELKLQQSGTQT